MLTRASDVHSLRVALPEPVPTHLPNPRPDEAAQLVRPGSVVELDIACRTPGILCEAAAAAALALFDRDTRVWLSPSADCSRVRKYLRSQTASIQVQERMLADFAIVARPGELPLLASFHRGTEADPGSSTTLIVQVDSLEGNGPLRLSGPGIQGARSIEAKGLGEAFLSQWSGNARLSPRGADVLLVCGRRLCFLSRTIHIEV